MARTVNRMPIEVKYPSNKNVQSRFFNHYNWKGINDDKNFLEVDQETFQKAENVYVDSEGLLRSRPAIKKSNITLFNNSLDNPVAIGTLQNVIDFWKFGDILVYYCHDITIGITTYNYVLIFAMAEEHVRDEGVVVKALSEDLSTLSIDFSDAYNEIKVIMAKSKIFVFTYFSISYYDMDTWTYYNSNNVDYVNPIYVPTTKVITSTAITDSESPNVLTNKQIYKYIYSNVTGVNIDVYGKEVSFKIGDDEYTVTFTEDTKDVLIDAYCVASEDNVTNPTGSIYDFDVAVSCKNVTALYSRTRRILLVTYDGKAFDSYVFSTSYGTVLNSQGNKAIKFSRDGNCIIIVSTTGIYALSLYANTSTGVKTYPVFTNVTASSTHSALNNIDFSQFEHSNDYVGVYPEICVDFFEEDIFTLYTSNYSAYGVYTNSTFYFVNGGTLKSVTTYDYGSTPSSTIRQIHNRSYCRCLANINANYVWNNGGVLTTETCSNVMLIQAAGMLLCVRFGDVKTVIEMVSLSPVGNHNNSIIDTLFDGDVLYIADRTTSGISGGDVQLRRMTFTLNNASVGSISNTYFVFTTIYADYDFVVYGDNVNGQVYFYKNNDQVVYDYGIVKFSDRHYTSFLCPNELPTGVTEEQYRKKYVVGVLNDTYSYIYYINYAHKTVSGVVTFYDLTVYSNNFDNTIELEYFENGDDNFIVPTHYTELRNFYFAFDNLSMISVDRFDEDKNWCWYFPENQQQKLNYYITALHPINDSVVAAFMEDEVWYIAYDSDAGAYIYRRSKLQVGLPDGNNVITSLDGTTILFVTKRGLVGLGYQDFIASTEQALSYLSDSIFQIFNDWNTEPIRLHLHGFWLICYKQSADDCYIYDIRNKSWWHCSYPNHNATKFATNETELLYLSNEKLYDFDRSDDNYYDDDGDATHVIDWQIISQKLYLGAANYYKHIVNVTLNIAIDERASNGQAAPTMNLKVCNYRKVRNIVDTENFSYEVDMIRTFVKRLNYFKVCEFQYDLHCDTDNYLQVPLSLADITVKYRIAGEVR